MGDRIDKFINIDSHLSHIEGGKTVKMNFYFGKPPPSNAPGSHPTHRVKTDFENGRNNRPKLPMVFVFDDRRCTLTFEWQMYFVAINYAMNANNISRMWDDNVAFCNNTGFHGDNHRRNYILMEDLNNELPQTDKTRTCGDAQLEMSPFQKVGKTSFIRLLSLIYLVKKFLLKYYPDEFYLENKVLCLNGTNNPLLKPGATHPADTVEAFSAFDRYLYNPRDNPTFFFPATVTGTDFHAHPWPMQAGTGKYPWWKDGNEPVAWMFHIAPNADIRYPPKQFTENTPQIVEI